MSTRPVRPGMYRCSPVFATLGIPLVPGEMGKEWVGGEFISYAVRRPESVVVATPAGGKTPAEAGRCGPQRPATRNL